MAQFNYRQLNENIRAMQNPDRIALTKSFTDELGSIAYSDILTFVRLSMNEVDAAYTQRSKEAGERVKNHLIGGGLSYVKFEYQGSVMTDTHIKGYSDIDLLAISDKFYSRDIHRVATILSDPIQKVNYSVAQVQELIVENDRGTYSGNSTVDLMKLRMDSESILKNVYSICETKKPKSIKVKNLSLNREVDVVIANWYDDIRSIVNQKGVNRGIQIFHKDTQSVGAPDYPFLSISRINERSAITMGRLKKMIRFLKNIKAKMTGIGLSSYDFNAICYDIPVSKYSSLAYYHLVGVVFAQLHAIATSDYIANNIISVDESEYIFRGNSEKLDQIRAMMGEVEAVLTDLNSAI